MSAVISSVLPFPNIYWWSVALASGEVDFDIAEHFEKMSYRNRYYVAGANGLVTLSIPLVEGRGQRRPMQDVRINNKDSWQVQHWRTLTSAYKRAPYFDHYEYSLINLFQQPFERLIDFNFATIHWLREQLKLVFKEQIVSEYAKEYPGSYDLRKKLNPGIEKHPVQTHPYYQMFSERSGFLQNLSMLDLLFTEGPYALGWVKANDGLIEQWGRN